MRAIKALQSDHKRLHPVGSTQQINPEDLTSLHLPGRFYLCEVFIPSGMHVSWDLSVDPCMLGGLPDLLVLVFLVTSVQSLTSKRAAEQKL